MRVRASGPRNAKLAVVGMAPAKEELKHGKPFMGSAGNILNGALAEHGISRDDVFVTNVSEIFLESGKSLWDLPESLLSGEINRLKTELLEVKPNVVLTLGDEPTEIITGRKGITKWRGSILESTLVPGLKCVASIHPAWIIRGMWKWLSIFTHVDLARAIRQSQFPDIRLPVRRAITGPSLNTALEYLEEANRQPYIAFDYEVVGYKETGIGQVACFSVAWRPDEAISIPLCHATRAPYWTESEEVRIWKAFAILLQNPLVGKIAMNASFEWLYSWMHGIFPFPLYLDPMTMHHCLYPDFGGTPDIWGGRKPGFDEPGHGLAFINSQYTDTPFYKDDGRKWEASVGEHRFWEYNAKDSMVTIDVCMNMLRELEERGFEAFYREQYIKPFYQMLRVEWEGVKIDLALRKKAKEDALKRIEELSGLITSAVGYDINVNSPQQMKKLLYEEKGYQPRRNRKTGSITTDKYTLQYFADKKGDQALQYILEKRQLKDLIGDLLEQPLDGDGRIHTHYKQGGTDGLRWSSTGSILGTGTNLQNIPRRGVARKLFIAG